MLRLSSRLLALFQLLAAPARANSLKAGDVAVVVDAAGTVADVDNATLARGTVTITANLRPAQDVLDFTNYPATMGNISGSDAAAPASSVQTRPASGPWMLWNTGGGSCAPALLST